MTAAVNEQVAPCAAGPTAAGRGDVRAAAAKDIAAVSPGVVPFGVMLGVAATSLHSGPLATLVGAVAIYGGSAQLTTITLVHLGAAAVAAVLSGAVVSARVLLYGAALEQRFRRQPLWFKLLAPHFIIDQTYLSAVEREHYEQDDFRRYWGWLGGFLLAVWTCAVALGLVVGPALPPMPHLSLVGAALFVSMLAPRLGDAPAVAAAAVSAAVALAVAHLVPELGILSGAAVGVAAALALDRRNAS